MSSLCKTVSGLLKLLHPQGEFDRQAVEQCLVYALENHRWVKEQLKKIGGMEFYDVHFSYIDNDTFNKVMRRLKMNTSQIFSLYHELRGAWLLDE